MKNLFTLSLALIFCIVAVRAQVVTIDPNLYNLHFNASEQVDAQSSVSNNSASTRTFRWIRTMEGAPAEWTTTVCDQNNCYANTTSTKDFILNAGAHGLLSLTVTPNEIVGTGVYHILVYDIQDSANANAVMTVNVIADNLTGINDPINGTISIYPIPAKDVLNINLDLIRNINRIEVYNVVGQKLKTISVSTEMKSVAIPVSDLKKGVYFLRVYGNGSTTITKTFTKG